MLVSSGCEPDTSSGPYGSQAGILNTYVADKLHIIGLTEFVSDNDSRHWPKIRVYLDLLDKYDSRVKCPGVFRFELYNYTPRASESRGGRIHVWPDINLTDIDENNSYWKDHLRTYQFELYLDFEPIDGQKFILEATCIKPGGRRLSNIRLITYNKSP